MSNNYKAFFDGGSRSGKIVLAYIIFDNKNNIVFEHARRCGKGTSNIAEYRALIACLDCCIKNNIREIDVYGDSALIINQVTGKFKVSNIDMKKHLEKVVTMIPKFDKITLSWIPRKDNKKADSLVCRIFDKYRNRKNV